jgi:cytochrome c553
MLQMACHVLRCSTAAMRLSLSSSLPILAALSITARANEDLAKPALGAVLFQNACAACHGPKGEGNEQVKAPSIAGRPAWYALAQLGNFREGRSGTNPAEPQAMVMAAIVKTLAWEQMEAVSAHIEQLDPVRPAQPGALKNVDLALGKELFEVRCMECHRFNASGEMTFGSPPLTGLQEWYLLAQIDKFKTGRRGTLAGDPNGAKMVLSARFIEDDQARNSVVAYILTLNPVANPADEAERVFGAAPKP